MTYQLFWILAGIGISVALLGATFGGLWIARTVRERRAATLSDTGPAVMMAMADDIQVMDVRQLDRIDISQVRDTGLTTRIARYEFDLEFWWTNTDGSKGHHGPQTYVWPNDLSDVPPHIVKRWATDLITQAVRWRLGLEPVPQEP